MRTLIAALIALVSACDEVSVTCPEPIAADGVYEGAAVLTEYAQNLRTSRVTVRTTETGDVLVGVLNDRCFVAVSRAPSWESVSPPVHCSDEYEGDLWITAARFYELGNGYVVSIRMVSDETDRTFVYTAMGTASP